MLDIVSIVIIVVSLVVLSALILIDLRIRLLPNILVMVLGLCGFAFHASSLFFYDPLYDLLTGAFIGGGSLFFIRMVGNAVCKVETLGLGDVKLLTAGGLWLGPYYVLIALIAGAVAGILHGVLLMAHQWLKTKQRVAIASFSLPAGPGFIAGLLIAALAKFSGLPHLLS